MNILLFATGGTLGIGMLFWILMILWLLFGFWANWTPPTPNYRIFGSHLLLWFLLFLIGWEIFGFPVGR